MKAARQILALPFYALAFAMVIASIVVDLIGCTAVLLCAVVGGQE